MIYDPYESCYPPLQLSVSLEQRKNELIDASLREYMSIEMKLETDEEMSRRQQILFKIEAIFKNWVQSVAIDIMKLPIEEAENVGGQLFISGSHKLGVREPGADIDTICVAPNFCTKQHFFGTLKEILLSHPSVTDYTAAESARVPIMSFDFDGVSIDLAFARLVDNFVPAKLDVLDDNILNGVDDATVTTLNGPRVTMMIEKFINEKQFPNFLTILRIVRRWAKRRGLYGNKLGYLGGINFNLLSAFICQLYPSHQGVSPYLLLYRFFHVYGVTWKWPQPVQLNHIKPNPSNVLTPKDIWEPGPKHLMPMITPAYPASNSSFNVSIHTREIIIQEMRLAKKVLGTIIAEGGKDWDRLFEPSDFFIKYSHYLCCHIVGIDDDVHSRDWIGFVESRIRTLPQFLEGTRNSRLPLTFPIHLYPVKYPTQRSKYSICYFIGFDIDAKLLAKSVDRSVYLSERIDSFTNTRLYDPVYGFKGDRKEGCDFFVEHFSWVKGGKMLPKAVFESIGGIDEAKRRRKEKTAAEKAVAKAAKAEEEAAKAAALEKEKELEKAEGSDITDVETTAVTPDGEVAVSGKVEGAVTTAKMEVKPVIEDGVVAVVDDTKVAVSVPVVAKRKREKDTSNELVVDDSTASSKVVKVRPYNLLKIPTIDASTTATAAVTASTVPTEKIFSVSWVLL